MKKSILSIIFAMLVVVLTACVNYEKLSEETEIGETKEEKEEIGVLSTELGDLNNNGYTEKLVLEKGILKVSDGAQICYRENVAPEYIYSGIRALMTDLDADNDNEIVVLLESKIECYGSLSPEKIYDVLILSAEENGKYSVYQFPREIESNASYSGFYAEVNAIGEFEYEVKCKSLKYKVDVSRHYKKTLLVGEEYKNLMDKWDRIQNSKYQGESIGVSNAQTIVDIEGNTLLRIQQYIVGGDGAIIGYIETDLQYDALGRYEIKDIRFVERMSLM